MTALDELKKYYQQRDQTAREWKRNGGKVIGSVGEDVPEELLVAGGFFPLRVTGDPAGKTELADKYLEPAFQPIERSLFNRFLDGTCAFLDHLIISNASEKVVLLYLYLKEVKRIEPRPEIPAFYFFEFLRSRLRTSALYNRDRTRELVKRLEEWSGKEITDDALRQAIAVCNENRKLLQEVAHLRAETPPRISGVEALQIIGSAVFMQKADHNKLLHQLLNEADQLPTRRGVRLYVMGSSLDSAWFYELVESCGATIVAEDSEFGNRYFEDLVDKSNPPFDAIVDRYHLRLAGTGKSTIHERVDYVAGKAVEAKVDGAISFILADDNFAGWDYPETKKALDALGIPSICVDQQPYLPINTDALKATIESFIQSLADAKKAIGG